MGLFDEINKKEALGTGILNTIKEVNFIGGRITLDIETNSLEDNAKILGVGLRTNNKNYFVPFERSIVAKLSEILLQADPLILHNAIFDLNLLKINGVDFTENVFCTQVASWLEDENQSHRLADLTLLKFDTEITEYKEFKNPDLIQLAIHCKKQLPATEQLYDYYMEHLDIPIELVNLEMQVISILLHMQREGLLIDVDKLLELKKEYKVEVKKLEKEVLNLMPHKIDIMSPKQLSHILFTEMGLPSQGDINKAGYYSTAHDILKKLGLKYEVAKKLLEFREKIKTQNTYIDPLLNKIHPDGKIHTHFKPTGTRVGRISSREPNVQQVTNKEPRIRKIFKAPKGYKYLIADYSQMHLRILAGFAKEEVMLKIFNNPKGDIHQATADMVNVSRDDAKIVNFGIIYGLSPGSLAEFLKVSYNKAKEIMKDYKSTYKNVFKFMLNVIQFFKANGYVYTLLGRKRRLNYDSSFSAGKKGFLEREAFNSVIIGSEADIMKVGMVNVYKLCKEYGFHIVNQVHDEIVMQIEESKITKKLLSKIQKALDYKLEFVTVNTEIVIADNWGEKKSGKVINVETYEGN